MFWIELNLLRDARYSPSRLCNRWTVLLLRPTHQTSSTGTQRSWDSLWRTWTSSRSTTSGWWLTTRTERALRQKRSLCAPTQTLPANLRTMSRSRRPVPRSVVLHVVQFSHFLDTSRQSFLCLFYKSNNIFCSSSWICVILSFEQN